MSRDGLDEERDEPDTLRDEPRAVADSGAFDVE
jgi:hypothetical protein